MAKAGEGRRVFRAIWLAPLLMFVALGAWAFASPVGAAPDDDYHLVSIWCANGQNEHCAEGDTAHDRTVTTALSKLHCYAYDDQKSAGCQKDVIETLSNEKTVTQRGNFSGEYPPFYYSVMGLFAGADIITSAVVMRLLNVLLFVALTTTLFALLPSNRRGNLGLGWLITLVPLGTFLIASNNPSGWGISGVGSGWLALLGYFETAGRRKLALGIVFALSVLIASGSRADAAFFMGGAIVTVLVLKAIWDRRFLIDAILPALGLIVVVLFFFAAGQSGTGSQGFATSPSDERPDAEAALGSFGLLAFNILNLPYLWTGVFGGWGLGWLDTQLPTVVLWASGAVFISAGFVGLAAMSWRKLIALVGTALVLISMPVFILYRSNAAIGTYLQARYLLPLIVIFALVLVFVPDGRSYRFSRMQKSAVLFGLSVANFVALQVNLRRYVTGMDAPGLSLDTGVEWWWADVPFSPDAVWLLGSLAFAALVAILLKEIHPSTPLVHSGWDSGSPSGRVSGKILDE